MIITIDINVLEKRLLQYQELSRKIGSEEKTDKQGVILRIVLRKK